MTEALPIVRTVPDLRRVTADWRRAGARIALAPTMGALHEGHMSLVRLARAEADKVAVSIFVNPRQFGPKEDFAAYPRDEAADAALLAAEGCDLLFAPSPQAVYPPGFSTSIYVQGVSEPLEGERRPGHFEGVATVVAKLLIQAAPDVAVFGEKDYQQLLVIRRLAADLDLPTTVLAAPTARAADGLALSSRNAYLSAEERAAAPALHRAMQTMAEALRGGARARAAAAEAEAAVLAAGFAAIDYLELRDAETLAAADALGGRPARILAAARLGRTRLIDNIAV